MEQEVLQRKLDEARAEVARREREHEALLETAQKALANTEADAFDLAERLEDAEAEVERLQRLLDHATQTNPGTSTLVMLMNEAREACAERDLLKNHYSLEAAAKLRAELASARAEVEMLRERLLEAERERDEARAELQKTRDDFSSVWESRDEVIKERERARQACNAYWHDLSRIGSLCEQTADEYPLKAVERTIKQFQEVIKQRDKAQADFDSLEDDAAKVVLAYRNGDKIELDEAVESLASNGRPQWWENVKPIGLRGESDD
jgi:hypothetical protein